MIFLPPRRAIDVQQVAALLAADETPIVDLAQRLGWAYDRCVLAVDRAVERGRLEAAPPVPRRDVCPTCGGGRFELPPIPTRFYCRRCQVATAGPNLEPVAEAEPEQIDLFADQGGAVVIPIDPAARAIAKRAADVLETAVSTYVEERAPIDEGMAWTAEEAPDE